MGWLTVVLAGLVDGLNPCAFATLIFFVSYLTLSGRKGREVIMVGAAFTIGVFLAYLIVGLGFYKVLDLLGESLNTIAKVVYGLTAALCIGSGCVQCRRFLQSQARRDWMIWHSSCLNHFEKESTRSSARDAVMKLM